MINLMKFDLWIDVARNKIKVHCSIDLKHPVSTFGFYLNKGLTLHTKEQHESSQATLELRSEVLYHQLIFNKQKDTIHLEYDGSINGWMNQIKHDFISLNIYSAWFPATKEDDLKPVEKVVTIHNLDDFEVVNSVEKNGVKTVNDTTFDCIILAGKGLVFETTDMNSIHISLLNPTTVKLNKSVHDVLQFFIKEMKLPAIQNTTLNIVVNPYSTGGFNRKDFIVLSSLPEDSFALDRFIGHEIAHFWATGANPLSYEDWLNESFAELLSLLYLKQNYPVEKVNAYKKEIQKIAATKPNIKTQDQSRPDGVHVKGVSLLIDYWDAFDTESIYDLIEKFVHLQKKTTIALLDTLSEEKRKFIETRL